ncbi:hypothetical protein SRB5_52160 [Streptomyces sp. RB5]|uniref:Uncharacterized protein n=1 Tax=Streptomyces smaragdinus TaxID=2585196 RepID=A0A7K0CNL1_9ACTN|nr:hypothetical protein [Streptomyces smaragdinus]MQY15039.1 hypothetical protein [Streptomyces smaragdinus]
MIGIVGHADLTPPSLRLLEGELRTRLEGLTPRATDGVARVGSRLSVAFGRAARAAGLRLIALVPAYDRLPALPPGSGDAGAAGETLLLADQVRLIEYDPTLTVPDITADEQLVGACRRLLAVWDGSRSTARDATAHLVAYARGLGIEVDVVWPPGAARLSGV